MAAIYISDAFGCDEKGSGAEDKPFKTLLKVIPMKIVLNLIALL